MVFRLVFTMAIFGKVYDIIKEFEWKIDDFPSLSEKRLLKSPSFLFLNESWYLGVYPNGLSSDDSNGYVGLYIFRNEPGPPTSLSCSLSLKTFDGKKDPEIQYTFVFEKAEGYGCFKLMKKSTLLEKKAELLPCDALTVVCSMEYNSKSVDDAGNTAKCSHCENAFGVSYVSSHEQKCLYKPIRCPTCKEVVELRKWFEHECELARVKAIEKLNDDLKNIFDNKEHSDVTIKVKNEEFSLHRNILAGRNPYFNSMFKTEMTEKTTGIVTIDDCEPDIFRSFIHFIYTGKVDEISEENVCDLYKTVDKYQEDQLKEECLCFMKTKISTVNFCDFIILALKHDEKELLENATDLFCRKTKEIIQSVKWQTFTGEHPTEANELYLKAFDYNAK